MSDELKEILESIMMENIEENTVSQCLSALIIYVEKNISASFAQEIVNRCEKLNIWFENDKSKFIWTKIRLDNRKIN